MLVIKFLTSLFIVLAILFFSSVGAGCAKDYSFEGRPADSISTTPPHTPVLSSCQLCRGTSLPDSSWRFSIDGVNYCGKTGKGIITLERTSFTFFGPSACSLDSGFVASVYIDNTALSADRKDITAKLSCFYYDKVAPSYMFMSEPGQSLQLTITNYSHQSGIAKGTFRGFVLFENGIRKEVKNGQFQIRL